MRPSLALAALMIVTPAMAAPRQTCIVRVHKGATPYMPDEQNTMQPVQSLAPATVKQPNDDEILYVDTQTAGGSWVWRLREYAYHRSDVDLRGDCTHVSVE